MTIYVGQNIRSLRIRRALSEPGQETDQRGGVRRARGGDQGAADACTYISEIFTAAVHIITHRSF